MNRRSQIARTNRVVLFINTFLSSFLVLGYIVELAKGQRTLDYVIKFLIVIIAPLTVAYFAYFKNKESVKLKYITLMGYFIMYLYVLFTTDRLIVYVYLFPIILMYFLYFDLKLMIYSCSLIVVINVTRMFIFIFVKGFNDSNMITDLTIQFASVFLFSLGLIMATKLSNTINNENIEYINEEKEKQAKILADVLAIAKILDNNSNEVYRIVGELALSTETVTNAVSEISAGVANTAENISDQSAMTEKIHKVIMNTSDLSNKMGELSKESQLVLNEGINIVTSLNEKAVIANKSSEDVHETVTNLKIKTDEIKGIINLITGITEQTKLLALNAAIESARAGEAGKGFAVVADEVRKLAEQSKDSTISIVNIINELQEKADNATGTVDNLIEVNSEQNQLIKKTKDVFDTIINKMKEVNDNISLVNNRITEIVNSNNKIVDSINNITSAVEEATANAEEASSMTHVNIKQSDEAKKYVEELIKTSTEMKKYTEYKV